MEILLISVHSVRCVLMAMEVCLNSECDSHVVCRGQSLPMSSFIVAEVRSGRRTVIQSKIGPVQ